MARGVALTDGFHRALLLSSIFILGAAVIALRAANTRGEPTSEISGVVVDGVPASTGSADSLRAAADLAARPGPEGAS